MSVNPDELTEEQRENEATILYGILLDCCDAFAYQLEAAPTTGYLHYQGFMQFSNKKRFSWIQKNIHKFEFLDGCKSVKHAWSYATKLESRIQGPWVYGDPTEITKKADQTYAEALAAPTVREGLQIIKTNKPRDYCLYGHTIERNLNNNAKKPFAHRYTMEDFLRPAVDFTEKSTHVFGPSGTGKTSYVVAHFLNPLVISHIDALKKLTPDHDAIVFDDMSFLHWPPETVIHLVDKDFDRDLHIRYGTVHVPAGTIKVFTHNSRDIFYKPETPEEQQAAINRRLNYINIQNLIFEPK